VGTAAACPTEENEKWQVRSVKCKIGKSRPESDVNAMAGQQDLEERLLDFAVRVGKVVDSLPDTRMGRHIAGQLVRCGTSPAPNYSEACAGESRRDFIHKLGGCLKELRETRCWLKMICKSELLPANQLAPLIDECNQLCNIIGKSIVTAKRNNRRREATPEN
jgi:four helix bundle protein